MTPMLICLAFYLLTVALCCWKPNAGRIFLGVFYLLMAWGVNAYFITANPGAFVDLGESSFIPVYRTIFTEIVGSHPFFWGAVAIAWETAVGVLLLSRGRAVKAGLIMGIIHLIGITPFGVETQVNAVMVIAFSYLLTKEFPVSLPQMLRQYTAGRREKVAS